VRGAAAVTKLSKDINVNDYTRYLSSMWPVYPFSQRMVQQRRNSNGPHRWPFGIWATEACGLRENCKARLISSWFWEMGKWK
jgi:hypothetical protein